MRDQLAPDLEAIFDKEGYQLLGWGDAGFGRIMSNRPILMPQDYKSRAPVGAARESSVFPEFMKIIGANGVPLGIPEVFPALQTGMIDTVMVSALAAVALQWFRNVTHMTKEAQIPIVGATLVRKELLQDLPPEHQQGAGRHRQEGARQPDRAGRQAKTRRRYKTLLGQEDDRVFSMADKPEQVKAWGDVANEAPQAPDRQALDQGVLRQGDQGCADGQEGVPLEVS